MFLCNQDSAGIIAENTCIRQGVGRWEMGVGVPDPQLPSPTPISHHRPSPERTYTFGGAFGSIRTGSAGRSVWQPFGSGLGGVILKYACMICVTAGTVIVAEPSLMSPEPSTSANTSICGLS